MSKPNWEELGNRFGIQEAQYTAPLLWQDCATCGLRAGEQPCLGCLDDWAREADRFAQMFQGDVPPACDLLALGRAHQDAGATPDGQALIAGTVWLAVVLVCAAVTLAVFGAAWVNMLWLAPFGGR